MSEIIRKKKILINVLILLICMTMLVACNLEWGGDTTDETVVFNVGEIRNYEINGITYTFSVEENGVVIEGISPEEGDKIEIPSKIADRRVLAINCKVEYKEVSFLEGWTKVDSYYMFRINKNVEKVNLPDSVTFIGKQVFNSCSNLKEINLENVKEIHEYAFYNCISLEEIDLQNVERIDEKAFLDCEKLSSINLKNIKYIDSNAFKNCINLKEINLENIISIGDSAFENCTKLSCDIALSNSSIGARAFYNCTNLTTIKLKNVKIGESAFENCTSLCCDMDLSNSSIGARAFYNCENLKDKTVILKSSLTWEDRRYINLKFYNTGVNIQNIESEEDRKLIEEYCVSKWVIDKINLRYLYSEGSWFPVNRGEIDCDNEEFIEIVENVFEGKHLDYGESISLKDLESILTHIVDKDRFTRYYDELAMYEFIESINFALTGEELEKKCKKLGDECDCRGTHGREHEYVELDKNFTITNTKYDKIIFSVSSGDSKGAFGLNLETFNLNK